VVIEKKDISNLNVIHDSFSSRKPNLKPFLGTGLIGKALLEQLQRTRKIIFKI
jgi:hypothetical protein